ncbi:MAG: hypothetical protein QF728_00150 [Arenicellales bacterium]|nr:hypothetical protein [Arenicellales bacterium]
MEEFLTRERCHIREDWNQDDDDQHSDRALKQKKDRNTGTPLKG